MPKRKMTSTRQNKSGQRQDKNPLFVSSLEKAMIVINAFKEADQYLGQREIIAKTGLHKSAVQRFLHSWEALGYIQKDGVTKRYRLTGKVMDLSYEFLRANPLTPRTPFSITDKKLIKSEIEKSRLQGYVITVQELLIGEIAVAAPVINSIGQPVAAVHMPANISVWPYERVVQELAPIVIDTARSITPL
jgi:DNA-binding IclR family transcriptional regulator